MNSAATLFVASVGVIGAMSLVFFVEEYAHRIARWLPPALRAEHLTISGYEHPELVETVFQKTLAYEPAGDWPEIADASTVLDFGGGCGLHYKEAKSKAVRWAVVETPAMVARAKVLETDRLRFFSDIQQAAAWLGPIDVMHSNGALQYAPDPNASLQQLCALKAKKMLWRRVALSDAGECREIQSTMVADNGPGKLRKASNRAIEYVRTATETAVFLKAHQGYVLAERAGDSFLFVRED